MTRLVYQSQTHPSHDKVRDGIQDLGYKTSIDGRFCFRLSVRFRLVQSCQVYSSWSWKSGRSKDSSRGMLIGAMIRFHISRILANVRSSYQSIRTTCHPLPLVISSHRFSIIKSLLSHRHPRFCRYPIECTTTTTTIHHQQLSALAEPVPVPNV